MIKRQVEVVIPNDMEARPVALLVQVASQYESNILIKYEDKTVNAKSIMGMMSLSLVTGEKITLVAEGVDEEEAIKGIEDYLTNA